MEKISARRPFGGVFAVDVQKKPIVRTDMNPEVGRNG
jgi:hypothetical protein